MNINPFQVRPPMPKKFVCPDVFTGAFCCSLDAHPHESRVVAASGDSEILVARFVLDSGDAAQSESTELCCCF